MSLPIAQLAHHKRVAFEQDGVRYYHLEVLGLQARGVPLRAAVVSIVGVFGRVQRSGVREDYPNQSSKRYRSWLMLTSELPLPFSAGMMAKNLSDLSRSS